jgi:gluconate kinase
MSLSTLLVMYISARGYINSSRVTEKADHFWTATIFIEQFIRLRIPLHHPELRKQIWTFLSVNSKRFV